MCGIVTLTHEISADRVVHDRKIVRKGISHRVVPVLIAVDRLSFFLRASETKSITIFTILTQIRGEEVS